MTIIEPTTENIYSMMYIVFVNIWCCGYEVELESNEDNIKA